MYRDLDSGTSDTTDRMSGRVRIFTPEQQALRLIRFIHSWDGRGIRSSRNGAAFGLADFVGGLAQTGELRARPDQLVVAVRADGSRVSFPDPNPTFGVMTGTATPTESVEYVLNRVAVVKPNKFEVDTGESVYRLVEAYYGLREKFQAISEQRSRELNDLRGDMKYDILRSYGPDAAEDFLRGNRPESVVFEDFCRLEDRARLPFIKQALAVLAAQYPVNYS